LRFGNNFRKVGLGLGLGIAAGSKSRVGFEIWEWLD